MRKNLFVATLAIAVLLIPALALAQVSNFDMRYDPQTVTTISGTVLGTIDYNPANPTMGPQAVLLSSGGRNHTVFLGPGYFINQLGVVLTPGSQLSVTGSKRNLAGREYLVASRLVMGTRTFDLRTSAGVPLWGVRQVPSPPIGRGGDVAVPFDPNRLVSINGRIISTEMMQTSELSAPYVVAHVRPFDPGLRDVRVILGPMSFLSMNEIALERGYPLSITGSLVGINDVNYIVASRITQGMRTLSLRTLSGEPLFMSNVPPVQQIPPPYSNF